MAVQQLPSPQQDLLDFVREWYVKEGDPALNPQNRSEFKQHFVDWLYHSNPLNANPQYLGQVMDAARARLVELKLEQPTLSTPQARALNVNQQALMSSVLSSSPILNPARQQAITLGGPYTVDELALLPHLQRLVEDNNWNSQCRQPVRRPSTNAQQRECKYAEESKGNPYTFFITPAGYPCCRPQNEHSAAGNYLRELVQRALTDPNRLLQNELRDLVIALTNTIPLRRTPIPELQQLALQWLASDAKVSDPDTPNETYIAANFYDRLRTRLEEKKGEQKRAQVERLRTAIEQRLQERKQSQKVRIVATPSGGGQPLSLVGVLSSLDPEDTKANVYLVSYVEGLPQPLSILQFSGAPRSTAFNLDLGSWHLSLDFTGAIEPTVPEIPIVAPAPAPRPRKRNRAGGGFIFGAW